MLPLRTYVAPRRVKLFKSEEGDDFDEVNPPRASIPSGDLVFYTLDEAAELLRVHSQTIRRWIRTGKLPTSQIGRRHLISDSTIRKLAGLDS